MTAHAHGNGLSAGKLPLPLLAELLGVLPILSPDLLLGAAVGEDAAVVDFAPDADRVLVAKSDPITFATDEIGYYAVNICVNDLAVTGATPRFYLPTVLLPADAADEALARRIFGQIGEACRALDVVVAGGHSEITHAVNQPVVAGTLLGDAPRNGYVSSGGGSPGDAVLMAGCAPVEGTSIIAREMRDGLLASGWSETDLNEASGYLYEPGISVLVPALAAAQTGHVLAMHDPTEGGIATGLAELAYASSCGLTVDLDAIHVPELSQRLCAQFGLDPLGVIASGALLAVVAHPFVEDVIALWTEHGWRGASVGTLVEGSELSASAGGQAVPFPRFAADEITKLWA
jgi:hydrogenase expression/formation protein HypE